MDYYNCKKGSRYRKANFVNWLPLSEVIIAKDETQPISEEIESLLRSHGGQSTDYLEISDGTKTEQLKTAIGVMEIPREAGSPSTLTGKLNKIEGPTPDKRTTDGPVGADQGAITDSLRFNKDGNKKAQTPKNKPLGLQVVCMKDIEPEEVIWIWPGRIPQGKLTILAGDPGLGKSYLSLDLAARISSGNSLPDGTVAPQGTVLLMSAEDGAADTIRPRLDRLSADQDSAGRDGMRPGLSEKRGSILENRVVVGRGVLDHHGLLLGSSSPSLVVFNDKV